MRTTVGLGAVAVAFLTYAGCAVSTEPESGEVVQVSLSAPVEPTDPSEALRAEEVNTAGAELLRSFAPSAREEVCVSYDGDLDVHAIDEFECTTVRDPYGGDLGQMCAHCMIKVREAANGRLYLEGRPGGRCEVFSGVYAFSRQATARVCGPPPAETLVIRPACELGNEEGAKCQKEQPSHAKEYPDWY
jgi:hypothetical protein